MTTSSELQFCITCLDTEKKLYVMDENNIGKVYELLMGYSVNNEQLAGKFLCNECFHSLLKFCKFRYKSLKSLSVLEDLLRRHKIITLAHIKTVDRYKLKLNSTIMKAKLEPGYCDLYIDYTDVDTQKEKDTTFEAVAVKHENGEVEDHIELTTGIEDKNNIHRQTDLETINVNNKVTSEQNVYDDNIDIKSEAINEYDNSNGALDLDLENHDYFSDTSTLILETKPSFKELMEITQSSRMENTQSFDMTSDPIKEETDNESINDEIYEMVDAKLDATTAKKNLKLHDKLEIKTTDNLLLHEIRDDEKEFNPLNTKIVSEFESQRKMNDSSYFWETDKEQLVKEETINSMDITKQPAKAYSCNICDYKCKLKISLTVHMRSHEGSFFSCNLCDYKSKLRHSLNLHMLKHSDVNSKDNMDGHNEGYGHKYFACNECEYKTKDKSCLAQHLGTHTGEKKYPCQVCDEMFSCKSLLKKHKWVHRTQTNTDVKPQKSFSRKANKSEKIYACGLCDTKFTMKCNLTRHMKLHAGEKPFVCHVCDKRFSLKETLETHALLHTGEKPYACQLCDSKFVTKQLLKRHMWVHTENKYSTDESLSKNNSDKTRPYNCELCESRFKMRGHLTRHLKTHSGEKPFSCYLCEQKFTEKGSLQKHLLLHDKHKPHACDVCTYRCISKADLVRHKRTHTGEKPYHCAHCDFRCNTSYSLLTHTRAHTGEKPFMCKLCDYKCTRTSQLIRHKRTHTGEKRFSCHLCEYKCTRHCNLQMHMRVHTGDMLSCDYCSYKTPNKACLVVHIKRHMKLIAEGKA